MSGKKYTSPGYYEFLLPLEQDVEALAHGLQKKLGLTAEPAVHCKRTFYDSFDWRLYRKGLLLEHERCPHGGELVRHARDRQEIPMRLICRRAPRKLDQIPSPLWRQQLAPILEMRALLPLIELRCRRHRFRRLDDEGKTHLLIEIDEYQVGKRHPISLGTRLRVQPVRGYGKALTSALVHLATLHLPQAGESVALAAMLVTGIKPASYTSKYSVPLEADMHSDAAARRILAYLAEQVRLNEEGVIRDLDSEFLHDFRVALRRSRTLLDNCRDVFQPRQLNALKRDISWLAERTGLCRDLDVYLLDLPEYCHLLPEHLKAGLKPLHQLLQDKRQHAYRQLLRTLKSAQYQRLMTRWQAFAGQPAAQRTQLKQAATPVCTFAARRLRKQLRRILKHGRSIQMHSAPETLHALRKQCKKTRYLLEFFQDLFPQTALHELIQTLKGLQNVLGRYQDLSVQEQALQGFYHELQGRDGTGPDTTRAITVLVKTLRGQSAQSRLAFAKAFAGFDSPQNRQYIQQLSPGKKNAAL